MKKEWKQFLPLPAYEESKKGVNYVTLCVNDNLLIAHPETIKDKVGFPWKNSLILKVEDDLHDYLSFEIKLSDNNKKAWLWQTHLIESLKKLENKFKICKLQNSLIMPQWMSLPESKKIMSAMWQMQTIYLPLEDKCHAWTFMEFLLLCTSLSMKAMPEH